ncbi:MAG TPA: HAD family hydrolase [Candidatus Bathyarchaeia archaeon]|nr:HAD family hydrolase [Candidatus Bathyarchaeia archaeon]
MTPSAVLFDLFDTLVLLDRSRLPEIHVNGKARRTTAGHLHEAFRPYAPGISLEAFVDALFWSWQEAERIRGEDHREVTAPERFAMMLDHVGLGQGRVPREAIEILLATHMRELSKAVVFPEHHRELLRELRTRHRLAVVSNFDYTPTARLVLERAGVADLFETIVISDEVGWRKPKPVIFELALGRLAVRPSEALFVGDRADIDVAGAQGVGMASAWINREAAALPEGMPPPEFEIRDLAELAVILGG